MTTPMHCDHDKRFTGVFDLPKGTNGCLACAYEKAISDLAALERELASVKAHAEAMAKQLTCYSRENDALVAYRAAHPMTP